jgi:small subunit ribosomal protein S7
MTEPIKMLGKWSTTDIKVEDPGLVNYIGLRPVFVPKTGARYAKQKFYKSRISIVERLLNKIMVPGHKGKKHLISTYNITGKSSQGMKIIQQVLSSIETKTKENPVKILAAAVENAAPREEIVSIEYGGARYPKAVDCSPQRRVDLALRYFVQGSMQKSFNKKKKFYDCLSEEIINAFNKSPNSNAIGKKLELERQAEASR